MGPFRSLDPPESRTVRQTTFHRTLSFVGEIRLKGRSPKVKHNRENLACLDYSPYCILQLKAPL